MSARRVALRDRVINAVAHRTYGEVAEALGVTRGAVAGLVSRSRAAGAEVVTLPTTGSPRDVAQRAANALAKPVAVERTRATVARAAFRPRTAVNAWSVADDEALRRRVLAGEHPSVIAPDLGRTAGAVRRRASNLGLQVARTTEWTPTLDGEILALRARGVVDADIATAVGRTEGAVQCRLARLRANGTEVGLSPRNRFWTQAEIDRVAVMARAGRSTADIAEATGKSAAMVLDRMQALRDEGRLPGARLHDEREPGAVRRPKPGRDPLLAALRAVYGGH